MAFEAINSTFKGDESALETATAKLENLSFSEVDDWFTNADSQQSKL